MGGKYNNILSEIYVLVLEIIVCVCLVFRYKVNVAFLTVMLKQESLRNSTFMEKINDKFED